MAKKYSEESKKRQIEGARKSALIGKQQKQKRIEEYDSNPSRCKSCEEPIPYDKRKNKFCGHSCSASYNNKGTVRNFVDGKGSVKKCIFCEKETTNSKFCNHECNAAFIKQEIYNKIEKEGKITAVVTGKRYLVETRGNKCENCGLTEWLGEPIVMIMDHINGNSEDNSLDNLRLICPNCDSQLPTYKGRNKGNGRYSRRQKYSQGKSY